MMKFKKLASVLALTIALAQVFTAVPVRAEETTTETCSHSNCPKYNGIDYGSVCSDCWTDNFSCVSNDNGVDHTYSYVCKCGYQDSFDIDCYFENGKCRDCGQEQKYTTCIHEKCGNSVTGRAECDECLVAGLEFNYIKINDKEHKVIDVCIACSSEDAVWSEGDTHWNYENGYCICGHYVGITSGGSCGGSVSGNGISKEEVKVEAPTEEEIAEMKAEAISQAVEEKIKEEEAIPVTDFVSTEAINSLPAEVKGTTGDAAVYNLSKITTTQGFVAAVNKIVEANKGANGKVEKAVTFYSASPIAFNATSLVALSDAATEFVYMFRHEGQLYKVTIPAGAKVDLEGQMFAGPLYIGAKLGSTVLVK